MRKLWDPAPSPTLTLVANDLNISASQAKEFNTCPRKWAMGKIFKVKPPDAYHFKLGHAFHAIAERYLSMQATTWAQLFPEGWSKGLEPESIEWCRHMAELAVEKGVWQAKPGITIEHPVAYLVGPEHLDSRGLPLLAEAETFVDDKDVRRIAKLTRLADGRPLPSGWDRLPPFVGFIDLLDLPDAEVVDHKTSSQRRYVLSPAKLAKDTQVLCYAATPLALRPELSKVRLRHNAFLKTPGAEEPVIRVEAEASLEAVQNNWTDILRIAEDMATIRRMVKLNVVPDHPEERARDFHMIKSAIDMGCTRDACEAYGGCPFRDACFGRATIAQVVRRLDAPDITGLVRSKGVLAQNSPPPPLSPRTGLIARYLQEQAAMSFPKPQPAGPKFAVHQQVYARDPSNEAVQYRCMILNAGSPGVSDPIVAVYPDADVEPDTNSLPNDFIFPIPEAGLQSLPFFGAKITGYSFTITLANGVVPPWRPAASPRHTPAAPAAPAPASVVNVNAQPPEVGAIETTDKPVRRPERDGKFGGGLLPPAPATPGVAQGVLRPGVGAALAAQATRVQNDLAATAPPAATTAYTPQVGDVVIVKATEAPYWKAHVGKKVTVTEVSEGLNGPDISFILDGFEQPPVAVSRFDLVSRQNAPATPAAPPAAEVTFEEATKLKGQLVCVIMKGSAQPNNGALEEVYQTDGGPALAMFGGKMRVFLKDVESCRQLAIGDVPGAKKDKVKLTPEQKAAAKAEKAAAKAAEKAAAKAAATPPPIPGQQELSSITNQAPPPPGSASTTTALTGAPQMAPPPPMPPAATFGGGQTVVRAATPPPLFSEAELRGMDVAQSAGKTAPAQAVAGSDPHTRLAAIVVNLEYLAAEVRHVAHELMQRR